MVTDTVEAAYVLQAGQGEQVTWNAGEMTIKTQDVTTDVVELALRPGAEPPLHVHEHEDEWLHVLEGEITVVVGDDTRPAGPGAFVWLPRRVPHTFALVSKQVRILAGATRPGYFRVIQELVEAFAGTVPHPLRPEDREVVASVFARYGVRVLGRNPALAA